MFSLDVPQKKQVFMANQSATCIRIMILTDCVFIACSNSHIPFKGGGG